MMVRVETRTKRGVKRYGVMVLGMVCAMHVSVAYANDEADELRKKCDRILFGFGDGEACRQLAEFFEKACALDEGVGCSNLGLMYMEGQSVTQDDGKAVKFFDKACDLDYGAGRGSLGVVSGRTCKRC